MAALPFLEEVATRRAGGLHAKPRTLAVCGHQGTVAYSMIGESLVAVPLKQTSN